MTEYLVRKQTTNPASLLKPAHIWRFTDTYCQLSHTRGIRRGRYELLASALGRPVCLNCKAIHATETK